MNFVDDMKILEEAVLKQEPLDNCYSIVEPEIMNNFPYFLTGPLKCSYQNGTQTETSEGVGMIIGEDLVLTSAHNLYYMTENGNFLFPKKIEFTPLLNGKYKLFDTLICYHFVIPDKFRELKKKEKKSKLDKPDLKKLLLLEEEIVKFDYGIVFLPFDVGDEIIKLFCVNGFDQKKLRSRFEVENSSSKIFAFVEQNIKTYEALESKKNFDNFKISMVSYIRYNSEYLKSSMYRYKSSFTLINRKYDGNIKAKNSEGKSNYSNNNTIGFGDLSTLNETMLINTMNNTYSKNCLDHCNTSTMGTSNLNLNVDNNFQKGFNLEGYKNQNSECDEVSNLNFNKTFFLFKDERNIQPAQSCILSDKFYSEDQLVICEAKGKLYDFSTNEEELQYLITTYAGQSGSPVFLRIKRKNLHGSKNISDPDEYEYVLIGVHSRSPKDHIYSQNQTQKQNKQQTLMNNIFNEDDANTPIDRKLNLSNIGIENTSLLSIIQDGNNNNCKISMNSNNTFNRTSYNGNSSNRDFYYRNSTNRNSSDRNSSNNKSFFSVDTRVIHNSFLTKTGFSNYNIGLKLNHKILDNIRKLIFQKRSDIGFFLTQKSKANHLLNKIDYFLITCVFLDGILFKGIFHKFFDPRKILSIAENMFGIDKTYFKLSSEERTFSLEEINRNEKENAINDMMILPVNHLDVNEDVTDFITEDVTSSLVPRLRVNLEFDIECYSEVIKNKITGKLKDYDDKFERKLKIKDKKFLFNLVRNIFDEIQFMNKYSVLLHGLLFKAVKDKIFNVDEVAVGE